MPFVLTPVYTNTLTGANQNPLDPTNISNGGFANFQILSAVGQGTVAANFTQGDYIGTPALTNNQFTSLTVHAWASAQSNEMFLGVRNTSDGQNGYQLVLVDNNTGTASLFLSVVTGGVSSLDMFTNLTAALPVLGDSYTVACVGTTVGILKNNVQLFAGTNATYTSGTALASITTSGGTLTNFTVTNMVFGNAAISGGGGTSPGWTNRQRSFVNKR